MELRTKSNKIMAGEEAVIELHAISEIKAWQAELSEEPTAGGTLTPKEGKKVSAGRVANITYKSVAPTSAKITVFGAGGTLIGRTISIEVKKEPKGIFKKLNKFFN